MLVTSVCTRTRELEAKSLFYPTRDQVSEKIVPRVVLASLVTYKILPDSNRNGTMPSACRE